jgi:FKBP-type peptidyl-prolyl cis-trans isomerase
MRIMTRSFSTAALWAFVFVLFGSPLSSYAETSAAGLAFLATKKAEPGVVETASGLLYKEIRPGVGKTPTIDSPCSCHYSGTLIDGSKFRRCFATCKKSPIDFQ